jgi:hypothetical protein
MEKISLLRIPFKIRKLVVKSITYLWLGISGSDLIKKKRIFAKMKMIKLRCLHPRKNKAMQIKGINWRGRTNLSNDRKA